MVQFDRLDESTLVLLEQEPSMESVWTCQEIVNSQWMRSVVRGAASKADERINEFVSASEDQVRCRAIEEYHVLNCIGISLNRCQKARGYSSLEIRHIFSRLDTVPSRTSF